MTVKSVIEAGICGFCTDVAAACEDGQHVALSVRSTCPNITKLMDGLQASMPLDAYAEMMPESSILLPQSGPTLPPCCRGCVVPMGLYRCVQVAAGLALPAPVHIALTAE